MPGREPVRAVLDRRAVIRPLRMRPPTGRRTIICYTHGKIAAVAVSRGGFGLAKERDMTRSESSPSGHASGDTGEMTGWAGWVAFAGIMLIMLGIFQAIEGFVAIFDNGYYLVRPNGLVINVDYTAWGWLHLIIGLIAIAVGIGLITGNMAARIVGVIIAVISATLNLLFIGAYPVWSTIIIAVDVIVIYAIMVHGRELKA
jgi:hypothetical protein